MDWSIFNCISLQMSAQHHSSSVQFFSSSCPASVQNSQRSCSVSSAPSILTLTFFLILILLLLPLRVRARLGPVSRENKREKYFDRHSHLLRARPPPQDEWPTHFFILSPHCKATWSSVTWAFASFLHFSLSSSVFTNAYCIYLRMNPSHSSEFLCIINNRRKKNSFFPVFSFTGPSFIFGKWLAKWRQRERLLYFPAGSTTHLQAVQVTFSSFDICFFNINDYCHSYVLGNKFFLHLPYFAPFASLVFILSLSLSLYFVLARAQKRKEKAF